MRDWPGILGIHFARTSLAVWLTSTLLATVSSAAQTDTTAPRGPAAPPVVDSAVVPNLEPTEEELSRAVRALGSDFFAVRQRASATLWSAGRRAEPFLRQALLSRDREVVRRAEVLLERLSWGLTPDTPADLAQLIWEYRTGNEQDQQNAINALIDRGETAYPILLAIVARESRAGSGRPILQQLGAQLDGAIRQLIVRGDLALAEQFLELRATTGEPDFLRGYAVFLSLTGKLDQKIRDRQNLLSQAAVAKQAVPGAVRELIFFLRLRGDLPAAVELARQHLPADQLLEDLLYEGGDWKELADKFGEPPSSSLERLGFQAAYQRLAGNTATWEKLAEKLFNWPAEPNADSESFYRFEALVLNDRPDLGVRLLQQQRNSRATFDVLAAQFRFPEALRLVENIPPTGITQNFSLFLEYAKQQHSLGLKDQAARLLGQLAKSLQPGQVDVEQYTSLIEAELELGLDDLAFEQAAAIFKDEIETQNRNVLLGKLFPKFSSQIPVWCDFLQAKHGASDLPGNLQRLRALFLPRPQRAQLAALAPEVLQLTQRFPTEERTRWFEALGSTLEAVEELDLARRCFTQSATVTGKSEAWFRLGQFHWDHKDYGPAADAYAQVSAAEETYPTAMYLQGAALLKQNREAEGRKQIQLAELIVLADDAARHRLATNLAERGLNADAQRQRELLLRSGGFSSWELNYALMNLGNEANEKKAHLRAADYYERYMLCVLGTSSAFTRTRAYLVLPHAVHESRARGHLANNDITNCLKEARLAMSYLPADTDLPIALVPELEKRKWTAEAHELFEGVFQVYVNTCKAYPDAATHHNNAAWLAARCRRRLDEALLHAEAAVRLQPSAAAYLDTLAEVHFQQGRRDRAQDFIRQAIALEADNDFYRRQLQRFTSGDPNSAPGQAPETK